MVNCRDRFVDPVVLVVDCYIVLMPDVNFSFQVFLGRLDLLAILALLVFSRIQSC